MISANTSILSQLAIIIGITSRPFVLIRWQPINGELAHLITSVPNNMYIFRFINKMIDLWLTTISKKKTINLLQCN